MKKSTLLLGISISVITCLLLTSCFSKNKKPKEVKIKDLYSVEVSSDFIPFKILNNDASLEYKAALRELYLVVIDEPSEIFNEMEPDELYEDEFEPNLTGFAQIALKSFCVNSGIPDVPELEECIINGEKAYCAETNAMVNGISIYYRFVYAEGKEHYYQVFCWTISKNENKYKDEMIRILDSFKEI